MTALCIATQTHPNGREIPRLINSCVSPIIDLKQPKYYSPLAKNSRRNVPINENKFQEIQISFLRIERRVVASWSGEKK